MASVNKAIIIGNLGRDPEVRYLPSGDAIANIAVATSYQHTDRNTGEKRETTEWHRISFFGKLAEIVGQYMKKGSSIYVEGRLQTRKYTDKDGIERYATDIIAENMQMLGTPAGASRAGGQQHSDAQDQAPAPAAAAAPAAAPAAVQGKPKPAGKRPANAAKQAPQPAQQPAPESAWDDPDDHSWDSTGNPPQ